LYIIFHRVSGSPKRPGFPNLNQTPFSACPESIGLRIMLDPGQPMRTVGVGLVRTMCGLWGTLAI